MLGAMKSEIYRLARNNVYRGLLFACTSLTLLVGIGTNGNPQEIFIQENYSLIEFLFIAMSLIVGTVWSVEYSSGTIGSLIGAGKIRFQVFASKTLCSLLAVLFVCLVHSLSLMALNSARNGFDGNQAYLLAMQCTLLLALSLFMGFLAIALRRFSYLTAATIMLYVLFRWLLASESTSGILDSFSYFGLQFRFMSSIVQPDPLLSGDCARFSLMAGGAGALAGFVVFVRQEF